MLLANHTPVKSNSTQRCDYALPMGEGLKKTLAENLKAVMEKRGLSERGLERLTGGEVGQKTINNLKNQRQSASLDTVEQLAAALKIDAALLLQPGFRDDLRTTPSISKLYKDYIAASHEGQITIARVAEREAEYSLAKRASGDHD